MEYTSEFWFGGALGFRAQGFRSFAETRRYLLKTVTISRKSLVIFPWFVHPIVEPWKTGQPDEGIGLAGQSRCEGHSGFQLQRETTE